MALPAPAPGSTALVTGTSAGLGIELAHALARRGHNVVLVARRQDRLDALAEEIAAEHGVRADAIACDLRDADARSLLVDDIAALGLTVEVLVNNAGYGSGGRFVDLDRESEVDMIRLNCEAVVDLCGRYAPGMVDRGQGAIMNVASTVSFQPVVRQATYSGSKAMVRAFSEALHMELRAHGVAVTALCPGPLKTEFVEVAGMEKATHGTPDFIWEDPGDTAEAGVLGLENNKRVVVPGVFNRVGAIAGTHSPHSVVLRAMDRFYPIGR
jgi:short-subunit dehydrogenase